MIRAHSGWVRAGGRWLAAALLAAAALAGARGDALAHANFARSDPPPNAVLAASPARLRVWFTEPPDPTRSALEVYDSARQRVAVGPAAPDAADPTLLSIPLALPPGVYTVAWRTVSSVDGDPATGYFAFVVGAPSAPPSEGQPAASQTQAADDLQVALSLSPGAVGANTLRVQVRDISGQTPGDLQRVTVRLRPPPPDLGLAEVIAQPAGDTFAISPLVLGLSGDWQVEVRVRRAGKDDVAARFTTTVAPAAPVPPAPSVGPAAAVPPAPAATTSASTPVAAPPAISPVAAPPSALAVATRASAPTPAARGPGSGRSLRAAALGVAALVALAAASLAFWRRRRR